MKCREFGENYKMLNLITCIQDYLVFGLCPSSGIIKTQRFGTSWFGVYPICQGCF
jgi:hypothetical protein